MAAAALVVLSTAVFFASGAAALLYQVAWQRLLVLFSGADVYSATLVVAAFMGGLGGGSLVGGHVADRVSRRTCVLLFCVAELAIAGFGVVSDTLYHDVLYARAGALALPAPVIAVLLFASLLWPTGWMGASLPLLARAMTGRVDKAAPTIGTLYGFNTLGAAIGALAGTWWLMPIVGLDGALGVAASINAGCAALLLPCARLAPCAQQPGGRDPARQGHSAGETAPPYTLPSVAAPGRTTWPFWAWAVIYGCAGLVALSLEITWFRLLGVMMKATAFTFGTLLGLFLFGLGLGAIAGSALASRVARPATAFLALQAAVGLTAGALVIAVVWYANQPGPVGAYLGSYEPLDVKEHATVVVDRLRGEPSAASPFLFLTLYLVIPAILVVPPTFLMGCSFPLLQRLLQTDLAHLGRRVGLLLIANIAGSLAGALLTGWLWLDLLGTAGTLRLLVGISGGFAMLAMLHARGADTRTWTRAHRSALVALAAIALVIAAMPDAATLWSRLHGTAVDDMVFAEDGSGVSVIKQWQPDGELRHVVFVNGLGQSSFPYGDLHTALAAVPAFLHGSPRQALVIGLGSGDTLHAMAGHPAIQRAVGIEIVRPQIETLRVLSRQYAYEGLAVVLGHPRIEHVFGDGRIYLLRSPVRWDIIEADALRPTSAHAGNLYSVEYFSLLRERLAPGGLAATWKASGRVRETFLSVFPYVVELREMLIGGNDPIAIDLAALDRQLADPATIAYFTRAGFNIAGVIRHHLADPVLYGPGDDRSVFTNVNTDLDPRDEFDLDLR